MASRERYLKAIHDLTSGGEAGTTTSEVAEKLGVSDASVSEAVEKLEDKKLVCRAPYKGFTLSPLGKRKAGVLEEKYEVLEQFFSDILGLEAPGEEAARVVEAISDKAVEGMRDQLD